VRVPLYDHGARRKTVSVTLNADLVARSAAHGINISRVAEAALAKVFEEAERAKIAEEILAAVQFADDLVRKHGHPFPVQQAMFMPDGKIDAESGDDAA
jgi:post-segregation antitoxin (ccd killing protein)